MPVIASHLVENSWAEFCGMGIFIIPPSPLCSSLQIHWVGYLSAKEINLNPIIPLVNQAEFEDSFTKKIRSGLKPVVILTSHLEVS